MPDAPAAPPAHPPTPHDAPETFTLYRHGGVTVIGWDGAAEVPAHPADFLAEAADLAAGANADVLAVDLGGVEKYEPGLLGGLKNLAARGTRVLLFDPPEDVREVLRISKLDQTLSVRSSAEPAAA